MVVIALYSSAALPSSGTAAPRTSTNDRHSVVVLSANPRQEAPEFASSRICERFDMEAAQVEVFLQRSKRISRQTFHHARDWLPCIVEGEARLAGADVRYAISATLIGRLTTGAGQAIYLECGAGCRAGVARAARATPRPSTR
jgi:hypothetical protein